ncbi:hypothetical protein [Brevundimonas sp.]|uniref:hypothetical protein n=1 Tax=Brevundimonas sp. TaxID=1871086 RepID=UPI0027316A56|nr:hypothetical protein [Brevundimonas sp.]MDP1913419.1 hypothetical protein [Brevundimonas sp.]
MTAFEFFFGFFSLVMGLALVTVASGLANVLQARKVVPLGWLTPLLALLVLLDICSFWVIGWNNFQDVTISYGTIYLGLGMTLVYFLSAALVFPKDSSEWPSLDDYYDSHKRLVLGGVLFSNAVGVIWRVMTVDQRAFDLTTTALLVLFFAVLIALMLIKNRRVNLVLLLAHLSTDAAQAFVG